MKRVRVLPLLNCMTTALLKIQKHLRRSLQFVCPILRRSGLSSRPAKNLRSERFLENDRKRSQLWQRDGDASSRGARKTHLSSGNSTSIQVRATRIYIYISSPNANENKLWKSHAIHSLLLHLFRPKKSMFVLIVSWPKSTARGLFSFFEYLKRNRCTDAFYGMR